MGVRPFVRSGAAVSLYLLFLVVYILFDGFQDKVGGRGRVQWETYPHSHTISVGYRVKIKEGKYNTRDARTSHCTRSKNTHTHTHIAHWYARFRLLLLLLCPQQHEKMKGKKRKLINLSSIDDDLLWYLHTHSSLFFHFF